MPSSIKALGLRSKSAASHAAFPGGVTALEDFSLNVAPGEFIAILGPSGCGKSTLLRLIAQLDQPQAGSIQVGSVSRPALSRAQTAYVFQDAHLLPWRTVLHNASLPLELAGNPRSQRLQATRQALASVGLSDALDRYPGQLSGGMRMRVSLARAMVTHPRLLLLDEPFAALDEITRQRLDEQLRDLWIASGMTVVFVTHSTAEAVFLAQRAIVLSTRPGRIVHDRLIDLPEERSASPARNTRIRDANALDLRGAGKRRAMSERTTDARQGWLRVVLPPVVVLCVAVVAWATAIPLFHIPPYLLPTPAAILRSLVLDSRAELLAALGWTAVVSLLGFAISALAGVLIALALSASSVLRRAIYPYTIFFQTVPIISIAPLLVIWIGAGLGSVAVCTVVVSIFPVIANTLVGLLSTDPALVDLFHLYGAGRVATFWKLRLPWALPSVFSGLRVAAGLAVIGTVVAEFFVGNIIQGSGLGVKIVAANKVGRTDLMFASVLLACLLGLAMFGAVNFLAWLTLRRWHASEQ
jgi:NitT/TauT family transport system ATP-binding protein